jgi:glycyl-tRNA synthetase beta chain
VLAGLEADDIPYDRENSRSYSTPRRLALFVSDVASAQPDRQQDRRGPARSAAFDDDGKPTAAALGFARSVGLDVSELETIRNEKGEWLFARVHQPGKPLSELIYPILEQAAKQLPVPKPMRWSDHDFTFVRPVHWLVVMHGSEVLGGRLLGQDAANLTRGHRIHAPGPHAIGHASDYLSVLHDARVLADQDQRRSRIREALLQTNPNVNVAAALLDEVNNLVEWPVAIECAFESEFLEVPHAALVASMQDHQKFFPVLDPEDHSRITNRFVAIANLESENVASVREGYERVIRPRLADARFFLEQDTKRSLESFLPELDRVVFQEKIGTIGDKSRRISKLSNLLAEHCSGQSEGAERAALLSKCDLMSLMVGEFPELQGLMGRHYALCSQEAPERLARRAESSASPTAPIPLSVSLPPA